MAKLLRQNVGGVDYTMAGCALTGVCASAASDFIKAVTLSDGDHLSDGMSVVVTFANGNTTGNAPVPITIYSSDQTNYYSDSGMTVPFTLAPAGCYDLEYSGSGNAYSYVSYPVIQVGEVSAPLCNAQGKKASGAVWLAGDKVTLLYNDNSFIVIPQAGDTLTATTASVTVYGKPLRTGSTARIMFTADIAGANTTSVLTLTYNGVNIPVKVGKNGALSNFVASEVSSGVYKYVQAYTTLELMYDGTQFIIIGNPVVLSSADYTIYADGLQRVNTVENNNKGMVTSNAVYTGLSTKANILKTSNETTVDKVAEKLGENNNTYLKNAVNQIVQNIANYTTGQFVDINSGGPRYCFLIYKLDNTYWSAELMSYQSVYNNMVLKFGHELTGYFGVKIF